VVKKYVIRSLPLRIAIPVVVLVAFSLMLLASLIHQYAQLQRLVDDSAERSIRTQMSRLQRLVATALDNADHSAVEREVTSFGVQREIVAVAAMDHTGHVMYATRLAWKGAPAANVLPGFDENRWRQVIETGLPQLLKSDDGRRMMAYYPLPLPAPGEIRGTRRGGLFLSQDLETEYAAMRNVVMGDIAYVWIGGLLVVSMLILLLHRFVALPLRQLAQAAQALPDGDASIRLELRGRGEIEVLGRAFNEAESVLRRTLEDLRDREGKYRSIVDNANLGILLVSPDLRVLEANRIAREWFPYLNATGHRCDGVAAHGLGPSDPCRSCHILPAFADGGRRETVVHQRISGAMRELRIVVSPVRDEAGVVTACVEIIDDVTERVAAMRELSRLGQTLRVVSAATAAVVRADDERSLLKQVCDILIEEEGYRMAWVGRAEHDAECSITPLVHAGFEDGYLSAGRFSWGDNAYGQGPAGRAIRERRPVLVTDIGHDPRFAPWREAALRRGYASILGLPLVVDDVVDSALVVYARDPDAFNGDELALMTELSQTLAYGIQSLRAQAARNRGEEALRRLNAELEERIEGRTEELRRINGELEAFTYSVSHDLRAPLRGIDGFSKVLMDKYAPQLDDQARHYLERVRKASQHMGQLIDDLLSLSRINRYELSRRRVDLSTMATAILSELREREPERHVESVIEPGLEAWCDLSMARVVLENLLGNAWKYTGRRDPARIEFGQAQTAVGRIFLVRDNGAGFDMRYVDKIFAPFQRLHRQAEFEGTGIGLATVQRIIQRHGGNIWAESALDQGTTVYFHFGHAAVERVMLGIYEDDA
jgi:signal transduction histidine kinase/PAS domain-containing protein